MISSAVILNAAYVALLASTATRTITWLRVMLVAAAVGFVAYGAIEGIRSMLIWNLVTGSMHTFRLVRDYLQQRSVTLTQEQTQIRDDFMSGLGDFDFSLLWAMGEGRNYHDQVLIADGDEPTTVSIVLDGVALIERDGDVIRGIRRGGLIGEMSFVSGQAANATVRADGTLTVHQWRQSDLSSLAQVRPASAKAFDKLLRHDLVNKARS